MLGRPRGTPTPCAIGGGGTASNRKLVCIQPMMPVRTVLIDNFDSYTYNLFQLLAEVNGGEASSILLPTHHQCIDSFCTGKLSGEEASSSGPEVS